MRPLCAHYGLKEDDKTIRDWHFLIFTVLNLEVGGQDSLPPLHGATSFLPGFYFPGLLFFERLNGGGHSIRNHIHLRVFL